LIAIGKRVRHRKQPAWGVGRVTQTQKSGELVELVIAFPDTERRLRLKPDVVATMIEVLTEEENAAVDQAEAAAKKAARTEARQRSRHKAAKKHAARLRQELRCLTIVDDHEGHAVLAIHADGEECLRWVSPDGETAVDLELPEPLPTVTFAPGRRFVPTDIVDDGAGLFIGTRTHNWGDVVFARRGTRSRMWRAPVAMGVTRAIAWPGGGAIVHDMERVILARADGDATQIPIALEGRTIGSATAWGDGILVALHGPKDAAEYFNFVYLGLDGTVRFRGIGAEPTRIDDDTMIAYDARGVQAFDRSGAPAGRLDVSVGRFDSERRRPFARMDDELVFTLGGEDSGLVRWHPRVDAPRWVSTLSKLSESFVHPVRVGRYIAVTSSVYAEPESPRVWLVDAETGALEHAFEIKKPPSYLLPVGDDALVAVAFSKQPIAWRNLASEPERLLLVHPDECFDAVAPVPGVVITSDSQGINYFDL
jgi:hypothetical protein